MEYCLAGFNGQRPDPVSGHSHLGNGYRAYNPVLGRFTAPDSWSPFGVGGINPYAYCIGDPVNRADPSGHFSLGQGIGMALGIVAGIALSVLTDGLALGPMASLLASMAGDAFIAGVTEYAVQKIDGQQVSGGQVGMAAVLGAAMALVGGNSWFGGSKNIRNAKIITQWSDEGNLIPLFRSRYQRIQNGREIKSVNHLFDDIYKGGKRLNVVMHGTYDHDLGYSRVFRGVRGINKIMEGNEFATWLRDVKGVKFDSYRNVRIISCRSADGGENSFAAAFAREVKIPTKGFEGIVSTESSIQYYANRTNKYNYPDSDPLRMSVEQANSALIAKGNRGRTLFRIVKEDEDFEYSPRHFDSEGHLLD
jgi:RHS repeat-associated protein